MSSNFTNFESSFGFPVPKIVIDLLNDAEVAGGMPLRFDFQDKIFVLELQYFLDLDSEENHDAETCNLRFAVTTDGYDILINLGSDNLDVFQDEFGDIESLGITVGDLLKARKFRI